MKHRRPVWSVLLRLALLAVVALAALPGGPGGAQVASAATTNTLHISVVSARKEPKFPNGAPGAPGINAGTAVTHYQYIINKDNVGDPAQPRSPGCSPSSSSYPANCKWPSIQAMTGSSPIVTQGDQGTLDAALHGLDLPKGEYLISVMADNFKIDGAHFTIPLPDTTPVKVELQPLPLPTATLRAQVFEDNAPVNSGPDLPAERGLAGFRASITDSLGEVTTDVYGNPLCTEYETSGGQIVLDADGAPTPIPGTGGSCKSDPDGIITIPNLGPNRYALSAIPPDGSNWVQTTTLEGNHDWDSWLQEGATGYDTEFAIAGEPFPATIVGFVHPQALANHGTGRIKGVVDAVKVYVPLNGGLPYNGQLWGGLSGAKIDHPIDKPWIALSDLNNGDQAIYVGQGDANGKFDIPTVPAGDYTLTYWDGPQNYILDLVNVTVKDGETVDLGNLFLTGWFTKVDGYVFNDLNSNGKRDAGEPGISGYNVALKRRTNTLMDRGSTLVVTDPSGYYTMENAYPLTQWLVVEAYSDRYYTTGITYQTDNQPTPTTVLGAGVDVNVLPIIGQSGQLDWGVKPYAAGENGGIVGTVSYDTTRNELNPRFAAVENWQPGIPGLNVRLYQPVDCGTNANTPCDDNGLYELVASGPNAGAYAKGKLLNTYVTETWARPKDCQARDVDGKPIDQQVLPPATGGYDCLEGPLMGTQFDEEFAAVDGNYGFGDGCFVGTLNDSDPNNPTCAGGSFDPLPAGDYLVDVEIPNDSFGKPMYKVTREEDINIFSGNGYVPQIPPPPCAGALHIVDVADGTDNYQATTLANGVTVGASTPTTNPDFVHGGGSPYEGQALPLCSTKLVTVSDRRSVAPTFNLFTDVPVPGRFYGYIVDDLNLSTNPQDLLFGEKAGVPNSPVGIYDFSDRLVTTVNSDPNGIFDVLLPSTTTINCPSPTGVCTNLYRMVGNDPGVPGALNPNYNPQFRTIAATFELFPGDIIPADLAPTQVGVSIQGPGSQFNSAVTCALDTTTPQIFAVNKPYLKASDLSPMSRTLTVTGVGFGNTPGKVLLGATQMGVSSWTDRSISFNVPLPPAIAAGPYQLSIVGANGMKSVNGLTIHVMSTTTPAYNPTVYDVGTGSTMYHSIQAAIDAAQNNAQALVVVYPGGVPDASNPAYNPRKAYFENLIISSPVKLQGVGPGGVYPDKSVVEGSIIDGGAFGGDTPLADAWRTRLGGMTWAGNQTPYEGQTVYLLARTTNQFAMSPAYKPAIDGFSIQGGDQTGFPNNINVIGGTPTGLPATVQTQGGGIFANGYVRSLQITNNIFQNNGGAYGGAIRMGTPDLPAPDTNNHNENLVIANNRVIANGGTNLAGGIGIFAGTDNYEVANNDICGNFSAEYGGGISHYGLSPNGKIHDNRIYFNRSYDEAGAIMISGQLPANPNTLSPGAGAVDIYNNLIQGNLANDDGGGIRFLMAAGPSNYAFNVYNNMIVNNISTHEGGGIAIDDAPNVRVYNNTIMKNITTATAATSNGQPAPAGLSTAQNSTLLRNAVPSAGVFSNPLLFNNIFWDNRAGTWTGGGVSGIGLTGDPVATPDYWDLGVADGSGTLAPTNSVIQQNAGTHAYTSSSTNKTTDPGVVGVYDLSVAVFPWRTNVNFVNAAIVAVEAPANLLGNYHLASNTSSAYNTGAASKNSVNAPTVDYDRDARPQGGSFDIGADEIPGPTTDLAITKTDNQASVSPGGTANYTIVVTNNGPSAVTGAPVTDTFPSSLTVTSWACTASSGSSCTAGGSGNSRTGTVTLANGGSATFTGSATVALTATSGNIANTASVAAPSGVADSNTANNSATDTDSAALAIPLLDNFNRSNATTLGGSWSQATTNIIRLNNNQANNNTSSLGQAVWNGTTGGGPTYGAKQGAALTFASTTVNNVALILKATGGTTTAPASFIRVRYNAGSVTVETTTNGGSGYTNRGSLSTGSNLANGNTLSAVANADGSVDVWKTVGSTTTYLGRVTGTTFTGSGRVGMQLPAGANADNFSGGTLP